MLLWSNNITGTIPSELMALTGLTKMVVCDNIGLCGDVPAGLTLHSYSGYCATATTGTRLGSPCPSSSPSASPTNSPTSSAPTSSAPTSSPTEYIPARAPGEQPLKDNWFRKRDVARQKAFPQKYSWWRKQEKKKAGN
mmetsp:Transcript_49025/g.93713  ORF Transcript_49025/g.93713 Transcript_49025/m.93713 type:complete len:138 (-) Transcript_49025:372-785(-)|eukprot:CAMPEP_0114268678 /NCGR_PEP_ID=MMETSP0058-20121206/26120_1 /TAXON_ID=36894 /ORGANISM="Pyramimonas parkeae, CCMP726" /LENGTH=137 /DNA_ID=CAMNT_0001386939 /DNA_START=527 /DNA_END=940 /DNA_ORIENTATION=-